MRHPTGGGVAELPGIRLMASGLPHPQWNNGDVSDPERVDLAAVRTWYAERGMPWGVRVPADAAWLAGRLLHRKRLMGLAAQDFRAAPPVAGLSVRAAGLPDLDAVARVDGAAFEADGDLQRRWLEPQLSAPAATVALALRDSEPVGTAYTVRSDGRAGRCLYLAGVGVVPSARGIGVGAALSSWLVTHGLAAGAELVHLHPDTDAAARLYARLGFVESRGLDVYVDL